MTVNLAAYDGPVVLVSITPPGASRLPWDEEHCSHPRGGGHDGKRGCRVQQRAAREWNETATLRLSMLRRAASMHARRHAPVPVSFLERVWEPQRRGVAHAHLLLGGRTTEELEAAAEFVSKLKELAPEYDFGFVDAKGTKRRDDPRSRGRRLTIRGVELKLIPAAEAARYLSSYLSGRSKYKPSIRENAIAPAMMSLVGGTNRETDWRNELAGVSVRTKIRASRLPLVWLTPRLTRSTLVTMRSLRRTRQMHAVFHGRYFDDNGNTAPIWYSNVRDVLQVALIFRRTRHGRQRDTPDEDAQVARLVEQMSERFEAMPPGSEKLRQRRELMALVRVIAEQPTRTFSAPAVELAAAA